MNLLKIFLGLVLILSMQLNAKEVSGTAINIESNVSTDKTKNYKPLVDKLNLTKDDYSKIIGWGGLAFLAFLGFLFKHTLGRIDTIEKKYQSELDYLRKQIDRKIEDLSENYNKRTSEIGEIKEELHCSIEKNIEITYSDNIIIVTDHYFEFIKHYVNECGCGDNKEKVIQVMEHELKKISRLLSVTPAETNKTTRTEHF